MPLHRQLAAIIFTDIEGYTAIMQQDEEKAIALRNRYHSVVQAHHRRFNGTIIQNYGDGTLSMFQSAIEAVECALEMQLAFRQSPKVPVRVGLHIGDVVIEDNNVYGDGVNVASRIESLGVSGSVLISEKLNDEIKNHPRLKTISVGTYQLKNVERNIEVFALNHEGLVKPEPYSLTGKIEVKNSLLQRSRLADIAEESVAVLPFINMSNDPEQEYFSEGIAEEILNALSNLKSLKVAGRISSFQFNGKHVDYAEVGDKLGVKKVLEGSVRKQGNRVRVTAQLINTEDGFNLWSEKYDRDLDDIFAIQDEIALAITEKLKGTFSANDQRKVTRTNTGNTAAYELYLKGRFYINRRGDAILQGQKYFQQALQQDPQFALAQAGYADASLMAAFYGLQPPLQAMRAAKQATEEALRLDASLCEPYCALGSYYTFNWDWVGAEKNFLKSMELNPQYAQAHLWYGLNYLAWAKGDFENAEKHGRIAVRLEPLSAISNGVYGAILYAAGKFEAAFAVCKKGLELDAYSFLCRLYEGNAYMGMQQYENARNVFEKTMKISNRHPFAQNALIIIYCLLGELDKARTLMEDMRKRDVKSYTTRTFIALSAAYLGDLDEAFSYLDKAFEEHEPALLTLKHEHWVPENLKADLRFQNLLSRIGFPK
ncbi:MAG TPA: adenylate/guanylate cyclase domain-containing protein [Chitinophagaceae bacterium]|nr:adenylate/guanylate cyclase domain-containing protein [Chitinophagaceae bacterium]